MRKITILSLTIIVFIIVPSSAAFASDIKEEYFSDMSKYFNVSRDSVIDLIIEEIPAEDIPVAVFIAQRAQTPAIKIAKLRARGDSWMGILKSRALTPDIFYFMLSGDINSKTFAPIFDKFNSIPPKKWGVLDFTDEEIQNLVNLKFIFSHHDYSVFEVMTMRDFGKDYPKINNQVRIKKEEMMKEEKRKEQEAAEAKKKEGN
jgi:hypothetical protein